VPGSHNAFVYVFEGEAEIGPARAKVTAGQLACWGRASSTARTGSGTRLLSLTARPIGEPVARHEQLLEGRVVAGPQDAGVEHQAKLWLEPEVALAQNYDLSSRQMIDGTPADQKTPR
jgi:hypothetical protein